MLACREWPFDLHIQEGSQVRGRAVALAFAVLAGVVGFAPGAQAANCTWHADPKPWLPPGLGPVNLADWERVPVGSLGGFYERSWKVYVTAGYMYGRAWTKVEGGGDPVVDQSGARPGFYNVLKVVTCVPQPPHTIKGEGACTFDTTVSVNSPGYAEASGFTNVRGSLTGLDFTARAGCECGNSQPDNPTKITFNYDKNGVGVSVEVVLAWGADEKTDPASGNDVKTRSVLDEEYFMNHEVKVRATGTTGFFDGSSLSRGVLKNHYLWIRTTCDCGLCSAHFVAETIQNAASEGFTED